ncbi:hypothetical protein Mal64_23950 [Pseudobythopirellula maris]|uniref:Uncharacterized protein n=1 Tax=Pseudobythopirellula maris TaxID=2527991 RepID=A0A5C5ZP72_9BACT|nr:hypothetical protein [Pseudobythopirellula maris]TWT88905.1 hypothetical protein Mal64_23950 [Pseudobythopirellula maris]
MFATRTNKAGGPRRSGTVYVAVAGVAVLVSMISLTAMHLARVDLRRSSTLRDARYADTLARSGVEHTLTKLHYIWLGGDWRDVYENGTEYSSGVAIDGGSIAFKLVDPLDGDLANSDDEPLEIYGVGRYGGATSVYKATFAKGYSPTELAALEDGVSTATSNVYRDSWIAQYFIPDLPPDAIAWGVSSVELMLSNNGSDDADMDVCLYTADGAGAPNAEIEAVETDEDDRPNTYDWVTIPFSSVSSIPPGTGLCIVCRSDESSKQVRVQFEGSNVTQTDAHLLFGSQYGWGAGETDKALWYRVHGFYVTEGGTDSDFEIVPGSWRKTTAD